MRDRIIVTIKHAQATVPTLCDLELPTTIQVVDLLPPLVESLASLGWHWETPLRRRPRYLLYNLSIQPPREIRPAETLDDARILTGDLLLLDVKFETPPNYHEGWALVSNTGRFFPLTEGQMLIGRDAHVTDNPISLDLAGLPGELSVSRRHARLAYVNGRITLTDMNSRNGVALNNVRVTAPDMPVRLGDEIRFGDVSLQLHNVDPRDRTPYLEGRDGNRMMLRADQNVVGRSDPPRWNPNVDLTLEDPQNMVSRRHAIIAQNNNQWVVRRWSDAKNSTWCNGNELDKDKDYPLTDGDVIQFGSVGVRLKFCLPGR